jgi:hypothetical protein
MTCLVLSGVEAVDRLTELGLTVDLLERVVRRADADASMCTALDPPIMEGLTRWARTNRYLREELVPAGWQFDNPRNLPRTIHPGGEFAIVATTGDDLTGLAELLPTTKYAKGYATAAAVEMNGQLALDFDDFDFGRDSGRDYDRDYDRVADSSVLRTWLMLFHVDDDCFRVELSLPDAIVDGRITSWAERIIGPAFPRDDDRLADLITADGDQDAGGDVVVAVSRR